MGSGDAATSYWHRFAVKPDYSTSGSNMRMINLYLYRVIAIDRP